MERIPGGIPDGVPVEFQKGYHQQFIDQQVIDQQVIDQQSFPRTQTPYYELNQTTHGKLMKFFVESLTTRPRNIKGLENFTLDACSVLLEVRERKTKSCQFTVRKHMNLCRFTC